MEDFILNTAGIKFDGQIIPPKINLEKIVDTKVDHPKHYTQNKMETIDVIENSMPRVHFCGYLRCNILKYMLRYEYKGGTEDLKKSRWYLNRLIKTLT